MVVDGQNADPLVSAVNGGGLFFGDRHTGIVFRSAPMNNPSIG
jgi:hypothetical protein